MTRPLVLTLGEPAGVGPEIIAAAWRARFPQLAGVAITGSAGSDFINTGGGNNVIDAGGGFDTVGIGLSAVTRTLTLLEA